MRQRVVRTAIARAVSSNVKVLVKALRDLFVIRKCERLPFANKVMIAARTG